ncbi:EAL domain-containing protein [Nodosilinea sp. E11]|uniref:EAL domain-containing protein n=1 Tax=Nodosilinea sp. E11 TaxID=3037479 RepID=UPI0029343CB8|nr:EAL domain-containing protein [Nodosilinea sp. E11]WOD40321.1 EAL domain-containing protein [Nodosilinea sp. E11]
MKSTQKNDLCPLTQSTLTALTLTIKDGNDEITVTLGKNYYSIGRDSDKDIRLSSPGVSRSHASLVLLDGSYYIVDGDPEFGPSKNGILVNGKIVKKKKLNVGDVITFCRGVCAEITTHDVDTADQENSGQYAFQSKASISNSAPISCGSQPKIGFFSGFPDLIISLDPDGHILGFQNATDPELPQLSSRHLGQSVAECFSINFAINLFKHIRQLENSQVAKEFESSLPVGNQFLFCEARIYSSLNHQKVVIIRNINERKKLEKKILMEAAHDSLTGLPSRNLFMEKVAISVSLKKRKKSYNFAVMFIDLDRFKIINDSLGHLAGDQLLVDVAIRLKDCLRPQDTVARLGGDEFAILLHDIQTVDDAVEVAERIQVKLSLPLTLENREIFPSASIGIAFSKTVYNNVEEIIKDADIAMYRSKASGRSQYTVFEHADNDKMLGFLQLDSALKRAIERQEFVLHYQPIFELKTQKMIGLEALIRWLHPQKGLLEPHHFFGQAEETGLTDAIGKWTLQQSLKQLREWESKLAHSFPLFLSINISKRQFSAPDFLDTIYHVMGKYQFGAHRLKLEIAESTIMANIQSSIAILKELEKIGIKIFIDDFGTGYSSLSYLHDLPIDALKIDKSFINGMDNDATSTGFTIIQSIIGLAHNLGVEVIAEGIECTRHVAWLRSFNCDYGQGFYFGKPVSSQEITPLIKAEAKDWCISHTN